MKWSFLIRVVIVSVTGILLILALLLEEHTIFLIGAAIVPLIVRELIHPYLSSLELKERKYIENRKLISDLYRIILDVRQDIVKLGEESKSPNWRSLKMNIARIRDNEKEFRELLKLQLVEEVAGYVNILFLNGRYTLHGPLSVIKDWAWTNHEKSIKFSEGPERFYEFFDEILEEIREDIQNRFKFKIPQV